MRRNKEQIDFVSLNKHGFGMQWVLLSCSSEKAIALGSKERDTISSEAAH
jgi:hypothetical protein